MLHYIRYAPYSLRGDPEVALCAVAQGGEESERGQVGSALMGSLQFVVVDRGTFWVLPLTYLFRSLSTFVTFAAAPLVSTPFVRSQKEALQYVSGALRRDEVFAAFALASSPSCDVVELRAT